MNSDGVGHSYPWIGLTNGSGWVRYSKRTKNLKGLCYALKAQLDKIWMQMLFMSDIMTLFLFLICIMISKEHE